MSQAVQRAGDLSRLHDIVTPPPVSLWPSAPGWWLVGAALLVLAVVAVIEFARRRRALRYRRAALVELAALRDAAPDAQLPRLLKRVALVAHPRAEVAALSGPDWWSFLDRTGGDGRFATGAGAALDACSYGSPLAPRRDAAATTAAPFDAAELWIRAQGPVA